MSNFAMTPDSIIRKAESQFSTPDVGGSGLGAAAAIQRGRDNAAGVACALAAGEEGL